MVGIEDMKKIGINLAVVFVVAAIFASVAPETAHKAYAFFEDKLGFGEPSIGYFSVIVRADEKFVIKYGILGDLKEVSKVIVSRAYAKDFNAKFSEPPVPVDAASLTEYNDLKSLEDSDGVMGPVSDTISLNGVLAGLHRLTLEVFLRNGDVDSKDFQIGIYNDNYVQFFKGGITNCVKKRGDNGLKNCDVDAQKRDSLEALSSGGGATLLKDVKDAIEAYNEKNEDLSDDVKIALKLYNEKNDDAKIGETNCKYESSGWWIFARHKLTNGCTPEEVDGVWAEYLKIYVVKYPNPLFSEIPTNFDDEYSCGTYVAGGGAYSVCKVKRQVVTTLNSLGWYDLRTNKGWEANV